MSYQSNAVLRRALEERLVSIGMCPDLVNDEAAVAVVCAQTGASREQVARELAALRVEKGATFLQRMGISVRAPAFLASISTTRSLLAQRERVTASRFAQEYRGRSNMTTQELIADLDMFDQPAIRGDRRESEAAGR